MPSESFPPGCSRETEAQELAQDAGPSSKPLTEPGLLLSRPCSSQGPPRSSVRISVSDGSLQARLTLRRAWQPSALGRRWIGSGHWARRRDWPLECTRKFHDLRCPTPRPRDRPPPLIHTLPVFMSLYQNFLDFYITKVTHACFCISHVS